MIKDFLRALARGLRDLAGGKYPLYYGRILQGAKEPCFLLAPPEASRLVLSNGRVQRKYDVELRFYPGGRAEIFEQQRMGERLICALDELFGEERNYRGRELKYRPGEQYLTLSARYEFYTVKGREQDMTGEISGDMMLEFGFALAIADGTPPPPGEAENREELQELAELTEEK